MVKNCLEKNFFNLMNSTKMLMLLGKHNFFYNKERKKKVLIL